MDDLSGKINELLSDPESMQRIKNLAGMLSGNAGSNQNNGVNENHANNQGGFDSGNAQNSSNSQENFQRDGNGSGGENSSKGLGDNPLNIDPQMLMKLSGAMRMMNTPDPRVDLLMALKENLSSDRQKKVDDAVKILRLLSLLPMLKEQGIFDFIGI